MGQKTYIMTADQVKAVVKYGSACSPLRDDTLKKNKTAESFGSILNSPCPPHFVVMILRAGRIQNCMTP